MKEIVYSKNPSYEEIVDTLKGRLNLSDEEWQRGVQRGELKNMLEKLGVSLRGSADYYINLLAQFFDVAQHENEQGREIFRYERLKALASLIRADIIYSNNPGYSMKQAFQTVKKELERSGRSLVSLKAPSEFAQDLERYVSNSSHIQSTAQLIKEAVSAYIANQTQSSENGVITWDKDTGYILREESQLHIFEKKEDLGHALQEVESFDDVEVLQVNVEGTQIRTEPMEVGEVLRIMRDKIHC